MGLQRPVQEREFNHILVESIDETITALLSQEVSKAIFTHLDQGYSISKQQVPEQLELLFSTLESIFGTPSSKTISKAIAKRLYTKLGLTFPKHDSPSLTLIEYVGEAKIKLRYRGKQL